MEWQIAALCLVDEEPWTVEEIKSPPPGGVPSLIAKRVLEISGVGEAADRADFVKRLPSEMLAWSRRMIEALAQGIRNAIGSVLNGAVDAIRSVLNRLNPFARSSPLLVEQVWAGVKEIGRAYESLKGLSLPAPQQAAAGVATSAAASGLLVINGPLVQVGSLEVRSEEDIRRVSQTPSSRWTANRMRTWIISGGRTPLTSATAMPHI